MNSEKTVGYILTIMLVAFVLLAFLRGCYAAEPSKTPSLDNYNKKELDCLTEAVYFEARSETFSGQIAVAQVIMNRVRHPFFPSTICKVTKQGVYKNGKPVKYLCAFSYWCDGKPERMVNTEAFARAVSAAVLVLEGVRIDILRKALYYHASYVKPKWSKDRKKLASIGNHIFYR